VTGSTPFDLLAAEYDGQFTHGMLGTAMRRAVWQRMDARFSSGQRVLELACGTGEDAVYLGRRGVRVIATDASAAMVDAARRKVAHAGLESEVEVRHLSIEKLDQLGGLRFDGALSNFGGLNCLADLAAFSRALAARLEPGAVALFCLMGPLVPWEWLWFLVRGEPRKAFRRLRRGGVPWHGLTIRYPSIRTLREAFAPAFRLERISAVGALMPPPYAERWTARHPWLLERLNRWERRLETLPPLPWLADHYLAEFARR
jgi:SAM-dependent methyltransferase